MAFNYDALYGETPNALGEPTPIFVSFFRGFDRQNARILDIGCGQGRDALFIARSGHRVTGVDISPNGIDDLIAAAAAEQLAIEGIVADITDYQPDGIFDVVLIDRTLHMLPRSARLAVLSRLLDHVAANGWLLIADEASNIGDFEDVISAHSASWQLRERSAGYLFMQRAG